MIQQQVNEIASLLLQLRTIQNLQSEVILTRGGRIVTSENLFQENQFLLNNKFNIQDLTTIDSCRINLQRRLIKLEISYNNKITAEVLYSKLQDKIINNYISQDLIITRTDINESIANYANDVDFFTTLLESKLQLINNKNEINLEKLEYHLTIHIPQNNKKNIIFNVIKTLAIDDKISTISEIIKVLTFEFRLTDTLQHTIINIIYDSEFADIFHKYKQQLRMLQQYDDSIPRDKYQHLEAQLKKQSHSEKILEFEQRYRRYIELYRYNGLELENKHTLVIGSKIADTTGSMFDASTAVFSDLRYSDLDGNILSTIDSLHGSFKNHNKFKFIIFTTLPGFIFQNIDISLALIMKIYDLLKTEGIVLISCGCNYMCPQLASHKNFIDKILIKANFLADEIVTLKNNSIYKYETCLALLENNSKEFVDTNNSLSLIARKI